MGDSDKIKILAVGEALDTGFGTVFRNLLPRLAGGEHYEVHLLGWHYMGQPNLAQWAFENGITIHPVRPSRNDVFGAETLPHLVQGLDPDVVLSLGDPWMVSHIADLPNRKSFKWVSYVPIDRNPMSKYWHKALRDPDSLVLYSNFGVDVMKNDIPEQTIEMVYHGVDSDIFKPIPAEDRERLRSSIVKSDDDVVIGTVCSNQDRKNVPGVFSSFKAWNCATFMDEGKEDFCNNEQKFRCDLCKKFKQRESLKNSVLYLHMTDGTQVGDRGIGWNIYELTHRFGLNRRVQLTPNLTRAFGVPPNTLNSIYNVFDIHFLPTKREGFGLPLVEAMAAGVPNVTTNYSSCVELIEQGGGELIDVKTYTTDVHEEACSAIPDVGDGAKKIEKLYKDKVLYERHRQKGLEFTKGLTWDKCAEGFIRVIEKLVE